jgi:hypothetical protein
MNYETEQSSGNDNRNENNDSSKIYLTDNSTLQTPEEEQADKNRKRGREEDRIETNTIEDVDIDAIAGSDRAGTNERKP